MGWLKKLGHYFHNVAVAEDQAANVVLGGAPDETISSRSQRAADRGNELGKIVSDGLDLLQANHGHLAEQGDLERAETVEQLERNAPK
jgi:hypothetical protein